ncbi:DNA-binding transcriptional regulator, MarR family [Aliiroseovarius crassostreae]|nr:MarR family winged helix-turn-helix transcriptional regulator [Aliiroseovarius crassostreae]SFU92480.1 DNA-binding transcriptional regulator, MarR family [Aliiroseovarius crassostreae]
MSKDIGIPGAGFMTPTQSPGFRFWQTFLNWQKNIDMVLAPYDLTQPAFALLAVSAWLSEQNKAATGQSFVRQKVVTEMAQLNKMQVSQLLKRLQAGDLVSITNYEMDRREKLISLTQKGWETLEKTVPLVEDVDRKALANVSIG